MSDVYMPSVPVTEIDLTYDDKLALTGRTVAVRLPDGTVIDLWIYHHRETTSVDVRWRDSFDQVNGQEARTIDHVTTLPNARDMKVAAVVLR